MFPFQVDNSALLRHSYDPSTFRNRQVTTPPWLMNSPAASPGVHAARTNATQQPFVTGPRGRRRQMELVPEFASSNVAMPASSMVATERPPKFEDPVFGQDATALDKLEARASATMKGIRHIHAVLAETRQLHGHRLPQAVVETLQELLRECEEVTNNHMLGFEDLVNLKLEAETEPCKPARGAQLCENCARVTDSGNRGATPRPTAALPFTASTNFFFGRPAAQGATAASTPPPLPQPPVAGAAFHHSRPVAAVPPPLNPEVLERCDTQTSIPEETPLLSPPTDDEDEGSGSDVELSSMSSDDVRWAPSPSIRIVRDVVTPRTQMKRRRQGGGGAAPS